MTHLLIPSIDRSQGGTTPHTRLIPVSTQCFLYNYLYIRKVLRVKHKVSLRNKGALLSAAGNAESSRNHHFS